MHGLHGCIIMIPDHGHNNQGNEALEDSQKSEELADSMIQDVQENKVKTLLKSWHWITESSSGVKHG